MEHEQTIRNLRQRLRFERIAVAVIAFLLITVWAYGHFKTTKSFILVDGKAVACVPSEAEAKAVLQTIKTHTGCDPSEVAFVQDVSVARAPLDAQPISRHKAIRVLEGIVSPVAPRYAIIVNGKPVVAVPNDKVAGKVLEMAKAKFGGMVQNLAEEPQFKENVTVDVAAVDLSIYCKTADDALKLLFSEPHPEMKDESYSVEQGDVAGAIASKHGISLEVMKSLNPDVNLDRLQIGDKLRVKSVTPGKPKLTVVVRDQSERTEAIPAPVQQVSSARLPAGKTMELSPGENGLHHVKVATIYENGRKVGSEIIDEEILREPIPRQIAIGIKAH